MDIHQTKLIAMKYLFLLPFIFLFASGEDTDTPQSQKIAKLQDRINTDSMLVESLHREMNAINNVLDSAESLKKDFQNDEGINRLEALEKIKRVNMLLNESNQKIDSLKSIKSRIITIADLPADKIVTNRNYFTQLEKDVASLKTENINLNEIIKQQEAELIEKDDVINNIKKEREEQEKKLAEVNAKLAEIEAKIEKAEQEVESTKREAKIQKAKLYYETGVELKQMFDEIDKKLIEIGTGKIKKELAKQAYDCFKKSYEMGYPQANSQKLEMESTKKYSKYLN